MAAIDFRDLPRSRGAHDHPQPRAAGAGGRRRLLARAAPQPVSRLLASSSPSIARTRRATIRGYLDWKLVGRTDRYFIKKFEDETNLRCHLLVDNSRSMTFGSRGYTKADYARTLAATLALLSRISRATPSGLLTFDEDSPRIPARAPSPRPSAPPHARAGKARRRAPRPISPRRCDASPS